MLDGQALQKLDVQIPIPGNLAETPLPGVFLNSEQAGVDFVPFQVRTAGGASNVVLVSAAGAPVVMEAANDDPANAQRLELPCEVAGQFYPRRDHDWYLFDAKLGDILNFELYSQRLGLPTDASLVIEQLVNTEPGMEQTTLLARVEDLQERPGGFEFDTRTTDPAYRFTAPADGTYRVMVQDRFSSLRDDPRLAYRLLVRPDRPDFRLAATPADASGALFLRKGGRDSIRVVAFRQHGFNGDIRVSVTGLPEGITSSEVLIGGNATSATLVLTAAESAGAVTGQLQIVGKAVIGEQEVTRVARAGTALAAPPQQMQPGQMMTSVPARMTSHIVVSVSELETAPVMLAAGNDQVWETARGGILKIPYTVVRRGEYRGGITGMPADLPPNVNPQQFNIDGGATSGEFQLNTTANTPPGTYTIYVAGFAQGYQYRRNPEAAQAAAERKTRFEQILAQSNEKAKAAADGRRGRSRRSTPRIPSCRTPPRRRTRPTRRLPIRRPSCRTLLLRRRPPARRRPTSRMTQRSRRKPPTQPRPLPMRRHSSRRPKMSRRPPSSCLRLPRLTRKPPKRRRPRPMWTLARRRPCCRKPSGSSSRPTSSRS
jgi:hypothetical protein